jgi:hypothetical protein
MKKLLSVVILIFAFSFSGKCVRIITDSDIARWYLDADLVLICNVVHTDTTTVSKVDSLVADNYHLTYDIIREKYQLSIDSIIKGEQFIDGTMDTIFTPDFSTTAIRKKEVFVGFDANGDSIIQYWMGISICCGCGDDNYFRIKSQEKHLVILKKTEIGYVIDYDTECDSSILELIQDVKLRGEDYFNLALSNETVKSNTISIYPNPFSDILNVKGIHAKSIEITDSYGKIVRIEIHDPQRIDLSSLKPGPYLISIFSDNKKWTEKILKQ